MIVLHHNDADGRCAAAIVHVWVGVKTWPAEFIEMDYAKPVPFDKIRPGDQVWIVDFSLKPEDMTRLLEITREVTWIDHHKTAIDKYVGFPNRLPGFRKDGVAGCVLTWQYVHWYSGRGGTDVVVGAEVPELSDQHELARLLPVPRGVMMIGDYDVWAHKIPGSTEFYEGMKLKDQTPGSEDWWNVLTGEARGAYGDGSPIPARDVCGPIIELGRAAIKYRDNYCEDMNKSYGFASEIDGVKCWVTNIYRFGSLGFGKRIKEFPVCAACVFDGLKWTVSLYSDTGVDVSVICKNHGGGGHKGAAGFVSSEFPFVGRAS
jgi:oligoribonuclease NrnB/cAMP/cGMP phosphodiesterase (DHH superfamily)